MPELRYAEIQRRVEEQQLRSTAIAPRRVARAAAAAVAGSTSRPPRTSSARAPLQSPDARRGDRLGIVLAQVRSPAGASGEGGILEVREAHGMALRAGISVGDRILSINGTAVHRIAEYEAALAKLPAHDYVALLVLRDGGVYFFALGASAGDR